MQKKKKPSKTNAIYSLEIKPVSKGERISGNLLKDLRKAQELPRHSRKNAFIAIGANIVIPGLGNYYLERNKVGLALTALSVLLIVVFLSPLFPLNSVGVFINPTSPQATIATALHASQDYAVNFYNPLSAYFLIPLILIAFSWLHLIFLLVKGKK
ncbi:MAG: hypothetical protein Q7R70_02890 [Candidatus Diapherotrites archaeon]|nr:hypothetical protein [Candidatus Diapherotrites archaeon]